MLSVARWGPDLTSLLGDAAPPLDRYDIRSVSISLCHCPVNPGNPDNISGPDHEAWITRLKRVMTAIRDMQT